MKTKVVLVCLGLALVAVPIFIQQRSISSLTAENQALAARLATLEANPPPPAATNDARLAQEQLNELMRLRSEVTNLRREKAALAQRPPPAAAPAPAPVARPPFADRLEAILQGPPDLMGTESGNLRRKLLTGQPLDEAEQTLLSNLMTRAAEIEKSPEDFSAFQTAFISSLLGWADDPRSEKVKSILTAAATAANQRQLDYHAPAQNADNWPAPQKALNTRATSAVQGLLNEEERQTFDKAFIGVLGIDFGLATPKSAN